MAALNDIPEELRSVASRMPHLEAMPAEEARHRAAHISRIEETAPMTAEGAALARAHARMLLEAPPVAEYLDKIAWYHDMAHEMSHQTAPDEFSSDSGQMRAAGTKYQKAHMYAPGLLRACEERRLGREPAYDECDIDSVLGLKAEKATVGRRSATSLEKAVQSATTDLDERISDLRKELNAYKAQIAADYVAANKPVPPGFLSSPQQHPDAGKLRDLEASAEHYGDKANAVTEHDLSAFYRAEAEDYEDRASKLRAAMERSI